ncbi:Glycolate permease GlcA [bacterium HR36]|uniref:L-lactate permease n=1 Tax=uncultured Planctomycetota bacterium TaxID=120965 RepID=H5SJR0_9BACT|nr:lactate transporter, LctP family [uncultured Planctomycetota bacterium]GBD36069.1 Glycolate permease GlcA [bacterium HR36]
MLLAYHQNLDPLNNPWLSTLFAGLPVLVLFWLLVPMRWLAPKAGLGGAITALLVAIFVYGMPARMAFASFVHGVLFGMLPVGWTIFNAMLLYNITVETGQFAIMRRSVAELSADARIQAVLIGFSFGAFLEGAAGGGTPVAICGAIMVGLGFDPFLAAVLCLIANTSPVAYGGLGTPIIVLNGVTDLPGHQLSVMAGHQLPLLSCIIPLWMVRCMCGWKETLEVWPAIAVAGVSFAIFQYTFATFHLWTGAEMWPMTDIGGGIFSLVVTAVFLRYWKPRREWHYDNNGRVTAACTASGPARTPAHFAEASAVVAAADPPGVGEDKVPLTPGRIALAWTPFAIMSVLLMLTGIVRQMESKGPVKIVGRWQTNYLIPIPGLDHQVHRDARLHLVRAEEAVAFALGTLTPTPTSLPLANTAPTLLLAERFAPKPERAVFNFAWLTAPGTAVFLAALVSMLLLRMNGAQMKSVFAKTFFQMKIPIPTIAMMLGLSYVTRYGGLDATLGVAFASTGILYPFFAAILGWLGVFLTGTDAGSNALFGSLQKITANEIYTNHPDAFRYLSREQTQILICTANSTGGVMGKMIDAQSICVATAATHQIGREADIFKAVVWHSIILAAIVGLLTLLQAYVWPFTLLVPAASP